MATSAELRSKLAGLNSQKTALENRISSLKKVKKNILNLSDEVSDVNKYYRNVKSDLRNGLKGVNTSLAEALDVFKQSDPTADGRMSGALSDVENDISRCESELDACLSRISSTKTEIRNAEEAERAAREKEQSK